MTFVVSKDLTPQKKVFYTVKQLNEALDCKEGAYLEHITALDFIVELVRILDLILNNSNHMESE